MNNYDEAKEIYIKHGGSYFFMDRGDVPLFQKYKSFNVPKELEKQWDEEMFNNYMEEIENEKNMDKLWILFSAFVGISTKMHRVSGLSYVMDKLLTSDYDTFTNLKGVEIIFKDIKYFAYYEKDKTVEIAKKALDFLKDLQDKDITVSKDYYPNKESREGAFFSDEKIKKRIEDGIKEYTAKYEEIKNKTPEELFPEFMRKMFIK